MDSYQSYVVILKQAIARQDHDTLKSILKNLRPSLVSISPEHFRTFLDNILDTKNGLPFFCNLELRDYKRNRPIIETLRESFHFLQFLIEEFHEDASFKNHTNNIKDMCQLAMHVNCAYDIKTAACDAFMELIEKFGNGNLELNKILVQFRDDFRVIQIEERRLIFCIIGKIVRYNKDVLNTCLNNIYKLLKTDSDKEYRLNKGKSQSFHMYFDAFSDLWDYAEISHDMKESFSPTIYKWIKNVMNKENRTRDKVMKSGMKFLTRHMHQFQNLLYRDYKYWYYSFRNLSYKKATDGTYGRNALKKFYRVIGKILTEQNEENKEIFKFFLKEFLKDFENPGLDLNVLQLIVDGFGQMTASYRIYMCENDVKKIYSIIINFGLPLCSSEQYDSEYIEKICCYQEMLANILYYTANVTNDKIKVLMEFSIYVIKKFPELAISKNSLVISSLSKTISNLGYINQNLLQQYLDNIIYNGIAWSCSHTLALDAELQQELENLEQAPICYKNYLPLWTQLLKMGLQLDHEKLTQQMGNTLMNKCVTLINRLDIRVKRQCKDTALSDIALSQSAVNQTDFRVFTNLMDLYVDLLNTSDSFFSINTLHVFLSEIVKLSYKHPFISGFYKLIRAVLKIIHHIMKQKNDEERKKNDSQTKGFLSSYLMHTLDLIPMFSNELLIACLYLILDVPGIKYVAATVPSVRTIPVFKIAFTMGLSDLELAYTALTALEIWSDHNQLRKWAGQTNETLCEIIPYLEPYLSSTESAAEVSQNLTRITASTARIKRVNLVDIKYMRNFQRQVLLFLGSLDCDVLSSFVHQRSLNTGASWDRKDLLRYTLPLPDMRLTIHFDRMLPRIIALARSSSDRRTRIAACEVLHSMVSLVIGSTMRYLSDPENSFVAFYATLTPALLALGCDSDEVVRNLFQPLTLRLMRWLSTVHTLLSRTKLCVLDPLFDGLCDDANPSLREFAGMCLAEFVHWQFIKQACNEQETQSNMHQLLRNINYLALHPSMRKRVAAAVAFNHLYAILREDNDIISKYCLEMLHGFVHSMDGCSDPSIVNALDHVEEVIRHNADSLNKFVQERRKPPDFDGTMLTHALYWLLSQCGVLDEHCRARCMELYINMSQYATSGSAQEITRTFIETYGINRLNNIILKGLNQNMAITSIIDIRTLLKALDYYTWLIEKKLLPLETLFSMHDIQGNTIFVYISNFQSWTVSSGKHPTTISTMTFIELEQMQTLRCKAVITVLKFFVQMILNINNINVLPESLWIELFDLIIKCIMYPHTVGFDVKNIEMTGKLSYTLETLLDTAKAQFSGTLMNNLKQCMLNSIQKDVPQLYNLHNIAQNDSSKELTQFVKGLIMLKRCYILDQSEINIDANRVITIEEIFKFLINPRYLDLSTHMIEYLRALMELYLSQHEELTTKTLLKLISINTLLIVDITHGKYFLNTFQNIIYEYMLTNIDVIKQIFNEYKSYNNSVFFLELIENLLLYLQQHKHKLKTQVDNVVDMILQRLKDLEKFANNADGNIGRLINIYHTAVHLVSKPTQIESTYNWILNQLMSHDRDIEYKIEILQNFFVYLINTAGHMEVDSRMETMLHALKTDKKFSCLQSSVKTSIKMINCFETLLRLLSISQSVAILECVIDFAAGIDDCLFDSKLQDHLRQYYRGKISDVEHISKSLEKTYNLFMNVSNVKKRFNILNRFLLPAFEFCNAATIEHFFEQNIGNLYDTIKLQRSANDKNYEQIIISKIGCYKLITIMFARVELNKIVDAIVPNANLKKIYNLLKNGIEVRKLKQSSYQEIERLLHCSAYNCTLAIVNLKEEEKYYCSAFGEDDSKDLYIWRNIVNCAKICEIGQTFDEYPKDCETTINIRSFSIDNKRKETDQQARKYSYIHSYDLSASTLNEDINAYDFNKSVLLPKPAIISNPESITTVMLESDNFNEHECMPYICSILQRISSLRKESQCEERVREEPQWLSMFLKSMQTCHQIHPNIKLFMLKIIKNTADTVFKPYAKFMLPRVIEVVIKYLKDYRLNYIITDILEILLDWSTEENIDRTGLQNLFQTFTDKVIDTHEKVDKRVYNYNINLIDAMIKKWHNHLTPSYLNEKIKSAPIAIVHLIPALFSDTKITCKIVNMNNIIDFLLKQLQNWKTLDQIPLICCCECFGLYLKFLQEDKKENDEESANKESQRLKEELKKILGPAVIYKHVSKQLKGISAVCRICPDIAEDYISVVIGIAEQYRNLEISLCLEIFALSIPRLKDAEYIVNKLRQINLSNILVNRLWPCEKIALRIVGAVTTKISPDHLLAYVDLVILYIKDDTTEHRELVYDMLISAYKKYSTNVSDDESIKKLLSICEENLLLALLDPSEKLQIRVLRFWTEERKFSIDQSKERLLTVLRMDSKCTSMNPYAFLVPLLMLQLANRSIDYNERIFEPLHDCVYEDYKINTSWSRPNLSCVTPMFIDSLASQMSCTLSQSLDYNDRTYKSITSSYSPACDVKLRTTNSILDDDDNTANADLPTIFDNLFDSTEYNRIKTSSRQPIAELHNKKFPRFLTSSRDTFREQKIQKNKRHAEMIKQESMRQRNNVKLYRNYRIGDFPDIAIPHSSLIEPLQQLIKLDPLICKDITVSLVCSLIKIMEKDNSDFCRLIIESLKKMLSDNEENSAFNAVILEILLTLNITDCDTSDIVRVSKGNNLNTLGILLLEKNLLTDKRTKQINVDDSLPSSSKRIKRDYQEIDKWIHLASLYKSLNDVDVVLSIFREQPFEEDIQKAAIAEANGNWEGAKSIFEEVYNRTSNSLLLEHCLQGMFEAVNNMCDWSIVDNLVKDKIKEGDVWNNAWRNWTVPYVCNAYVHMLTNKKDLRIVETGLQTIESWIKNPDNLKDIKLLAGEDLVIFDLKNTNKASDLLNDLLDKAVEQWIKLNPLCTELGMRKLEKLQKMNDLHASLKVLTKIDVRNLGSDEINTLVNFWSTKMPTPRDNLIQWNKLATYRTYSSMMFEYTYGNMMLDDDMVSIKDEITSQIRRVGYQLRLNIIDVALKQKHKYIAKKHLDYLAGLNPKYFPDMQPRQELLDAKYSSLCADLETDTDKKMDNYNISWTKSHLLHEKSIDIDTRIAVNEHISILVATFEQLSRKNHEFGSAMFEKNKPFYKILQKIGVTEESHDLNIIREQLLEYSSNHLTSFLDNAETPATSHKIDNAETAATSHKIDNAETAATSHKIDNAETAATSHKIDNAETAATSHTIDNAETAATSHKIGEHYYALARHYYVNFLTDKAKHDNEVFQNFVLATLKAMYFGYHEATHYFPCILQSNLWNATARRIFKNEWALLPVWLFLRWRDLLFSHLSTSNADIIAPIIMKLAKTYPEPIAYTYYLAIERNPALLSDDSCRVVMLQIHKLLGNKAHEIKQFRTAIQYVTQPELYLMYHLDEATKGLVEGETTILESLLNKVYPPTSMTMTMDEKNLQPGNIYKKIAKYESKIRNLNLQDRDITKRTIQEIKAFLKKSLDQIRMDGKLKDYSVFLYNYSNGNIEIPGQYNGEKEPMPRYHPKIIRIAPTVKIMQSLRKPICITMIGDNGREYKFLIKFGEDLTIDHGLQQLYTTMNRTLRNDAVCRQRRLAIDTYEVIPLSRSVGLIQWIENTKTLEELVRFTLSKEEEDQLNRVYKRYSEWIAEATQNSSKWSRGRNLADEYKEAMVKYNNSNVTEMMKYLINQTRQSALRDTFTIISPSPESFVTLRRNFVASYATMCAAHWISGVGDRHLQNTLVVVNTGRCLGIDFGHAFGAGLRLSIPELTPFRLTPQILGLLQPFTQKGLLSTIMTHAMRALRDDKGPILACMDIFIHEPMIRSLSIDDEIVQNNDEYIGTDSTWSFKRNIKIVTQKLNGIHPSLITLEELRETHNEYLDIIMSRLKSREDTVVKNCLTAAEQVECLLDQATDLNILGRMYANWRPWL